MHIWGGRGGTVILKWGVCPEAVGVRLVLLQELFLVGSVRVVRRSDSTFGYLLQLIFCLGYGFGFDLNCTARILWEVGAYCRASALAY